MNWFYSRDNQPAGPVEDAELVRLAQTGVVTGATLVWHSGLTNWQPYDSVRQTLSAATAATGQPAAMEGQTTCSQCGQPFPADEVTRVGAYDVCAGCKPVLIQRLREGVIGGQPSAGASVCAGFWVRFGAAFLDNAILTPVFLVIYGFIFFLSGFQDVSVTIARNDMTFWIARGISFLLIMGLGSYSAFCVSRYGGTPGKRICELRVVRGNGAPVTFGRAFGRFCVKLLPRLIPFAGLLYMVVDALFICFDAERRSLHDQICDTRVIHRK